MPLQAKQLIRSTTSVFFIGWKMQNNINSHSYGQLVIGSFITTTCLQSFLVKHQMAQVTQPPPQPRFGAHDFWLFPKLKSPLKGRDFRRSVRCRKMQQGSWWQFQQRISQCFEQWKRCWENCVRFQGTYFEGDWGIIVLCTMILVSCIFNKCLYFSQYMDGYFLDRPLCLIGPSTTWLFSRVMASVCTLSSRPCQLLRPQFPPTLGIIQPDKLPTLTAVAKWYLTVVFICIFLNTNEFVRISSYAC